MSTYQDFINKLRPFHNSYKEMKVNDLIVYTDLTKELRESIQLSKHIESDDVIGYCEVHDIDLNIYSYYYTIPITDNFYDKYTNKLNLVLNGRNVEYYNDWSKNDNVIMYANLQDKYGRLRIYNKETEQDEDLPDHNIESRKADIIYESDRLIPLLEPDNKLWKNTELTKGEKAFIKQYLQIYPNTIRYNSRNHNTTDEYDDDVTDINQFKEDYKFKHKTRDDMWLRIRFCVIHNQLYLFTVNPERPEDLIKTFYMVEPIMPEAYIDYRQNDVKFSTDLNGTELVIPYRIKDRRIIYTNDVRTDIVLRMPYKYIRLTNKDNQRSLEQIIKYKLKQRYNPELDNIDNKIINSLYDNFVLHFYAEINFVYMIFIDKPYAHKLNLWKLDQPLVNKLDGDILIAYKGPMLDELIDNYAMQIKTAKNIYEKMEMQKIPEYHYGRDYLIFNALTNNQFMDLVPSIENAINLPDNYTAKTEEELAEYLANTDYDLFMTYMKTIHPKNFRFNLNDAILVKTTTDELTHTDVQYIMLDEDKMFFQFTIPNYHKLPFDIYICNLLYTGPHFVEREHHYDLIYIPVLSLYKFFKDRLPSTFTNPYPEDGAKLYYDQKLIYDTESIHLENHIDEGNKVTLGYFHNNWYFYDKRELDEKFYKLRKHAKDKIAETETPTEESITSLANLISAERVVTDTPYIATKYLAELGKIVNKDVRYSTFKHIMDKYYEHFSTLPKYISEDQPLFENGLNIYNEKFYDSISTYQGFVMPLQFNYAKYKITTYFIDSVPEEEFKKKWAGSPDLLTFLEKYANRSYTKENILRTKDNRTISTALEVALRYYDEAERDGFIVWVFEDLTPKRQPNLRPKPLRPDTLGEVSFDDYGDPLKPDKDDDTDPEHNKPKPKPEETEDDPNKPYDPGMTFTYDQVKWIIFHMLNDCIKQGTLKRTTFKVEHFVQRLYYIVVNRCKPDGDVYNRAIDMYNYKTNPYNGKEYTVEEREQIKEFMRNGWMLVWLMTIYDDPNLMNLLMIEVPDNYTAEEEGSDNYIPKKDRPNKCRVNFPDDPDNVILIPDIEHPTREQILQYYCGDITTPTIEVPKLKLKKGYELKEDGTIGKEKEKPKPVVDLIPYNPNDPRGYLTGPMLEEGMNIEKGCIHVPGIKNPSIQDIRKYYCDINGDGYRRFKGRIPIDPLCNWAYDGIRRTPQDDPSKKAGDSAHYNENEWLARKNFTYVYAINENGIWVDSIYKKPLTNWIEFWGNTSDDTYTKKWLKRVILGHRDKYDHFQPIKGVKLPKYDKECVIGYDYDNEGHAVAMIVKLDKGCTLQGLNANNIGKPKESPLIPLTPAEPIIYPDIQWVHRGEVKYAYVNKLNNDTIYEKPVTNWIEFFNTAGQKITDDSDKTHWIKRVLFKQPDAYAEYTTQTPIILPPYSEKCVLGCDYDNEGHVLTMILSDYDGCRVAILPGTQRLRKIPILPKKE